MFRKCRESAVSVCWNPRKAFLLTWQAAWVFGLFFLASWERPLFEKEACEGRTVYSCRNVSDNGNYADDWQRGMPQYCEWIRTVGVLCVMNWTQFYNIPLMIRSAFNFSRQVNVTHVRFLLRERLLNQRPLRVLFCTGERDSESKCTNCSPACQMLQ